MPGVEDDPLISANTEYQGKAASNTKRPFLFFYACNPKPLPVKMLIKNKNGINPN